MKLQFKVTTEENQIVHLKNPFINGIEEKIIEGFNTEALAKNLEGCIYDRTGDSQGGCR